MEGVIEIDGSCSGDVTDQVTCIDVERTTCKDVKPNQIADRVRAEEVKRGTTFDGHLNVVGINCPVTAGDTTFHFYRSGLHVDSARKRVPGIGIGLQIPGSKPLLNQAASADDPPGLTTRRAAHVNRYVIDSEIGFTAQIHVRRVQRNGGSQIRGSAGKRDVSSRR